MNFSAKAIITGLTWLEWSVILFGVLTTLQWWFSPEFPPDPDTLGARWAYAWGKLTSPFFVGVVGTVSWLLPELILYSVTPLYAARYSYFILQYGLKAAGFYGLGIIGHTAMLYKIRWYPGVSETILHTFMAAPFFLLVFAVVQGNRTRRLALAGAAAVVAIVAYRIALASDFTIILLPWLALAALVFLVDEKTRLVKLFIGLLIALMSIRYGQLIALGQWGI